MSGEINQRLPFNQVMPTPTQQAGPPGELSPQMLAVVRGFRERLQGFIFDNRQTGQPKTAPAISPATAQLKLTEDDVTSKMRLQGKPTAKTPLPPQVRPFQMGAPVALANSLSSAFQNSDLKSRGENSGGDAGQDEQVSDGFEPEVQLSADDVARQAEQQAQELEQQKLTQADTKLSQVEDEKTRLQSQIRDDQSQLGAANQGLNEAQSHLSSASQEEQNASQQLSQAQQEHDSAAQSLSEARGSAASAHQDLNSATSELAQSNMDMAQSQNQLMTAMEEQKKVDSKKGVLGIGGSSSSDKKKAQDAVTTAQGAWGAAQNRVQMAQSNEQRQKDRVQAEDSKVSQREQEEARRKDAVANAESHKSSAAQQKSQAATELSQRKDKQREVQSRLEENSGQLARKRDESDQLRSDKGDSRAKLQASHAGAPRQASRPTPTHRPDTARHGEHDKGEGEKRPEQAEG